MLDVDRRSLGTGEEFGREVTKLGDVRPNELPIRVVLASLFSRVVDPVRVTADEPTLHLPLGVVDRRVGVDEVVVHEVRADAPPLFEDVAEEGGDHRPHPEVQPAGLGERPHRGVDHREAGSTRLPRRDERRVVFVVVRVESAEHGIDGFPGECRVVGELLAEVAVPVQARFEEVACTLGPTAFDTGLIDLSSREETESKIRRESRGSPFGFGWGRDPTGIPVDGLRTGEPIEATVSRTMGPTRDVPFHGVDPVLRLDLLDSLIAREGVRLGHEHVRVGRRVVLSTQILLTLFGPPLARVDASLLRVEDYRPLGDCFDGGSSVQGVRTLVLSVEARPELVVASSTVAGGRMAGVAEV